MKKRRQVYLVGIGMGGPQSLTAEAEDILQKCDCIIGAERMLEAAGRFEKNKYACYDSQQIRFWLGEHPEYETAAVVLSGDPGFYSGAKKLETELKREAEYEVHIISGISSVVYLAARLHTSWEDAKLVSAHGRVQNYIQTIAYTKKTFLLTGGRKTAEEICQRVREYGLADVEFFIGQRLSYPDEKIVVRRGSELVPEDLDGLCTVMVDNPCPLQWKYRSIPDEEWIRGNVPVTKAEVREVSLGKLGLTEDAVLYDIGAGTGSVAVEAALRSEKIRVYAIEKNPEGIALIGHNRRKFCTDLVIPVKGTAPEALKRLETPTHVFIGGSGGHLTEILRCVREKNPHVRIVINALTLETVGKVTEAMEEGLLDQPEIIQISVAKARLLGKYHLMTGQNPVYIVTDAGNRINENKMTNERSMTDEQSMTDEGSMDKGEKLCGFQE